MAGPYDLSKMIESVFQQENYPSPTYIAFFMTAYDNIYNWNRLNSFFNSPYAEMMTGLFDGSKTYGADHETAGLPCIFGMVEWFNQLKVD